MFMDECDKAKILVVDDRQDKLVAFHSILDELQQTIFTARSGEEALKLMLQHEFAAVLLDVNMPGLDGFETAALIRQRKKTAHTPVIFITSYADDMLTLQGYSLGAVDYIMSPVMPEILRTKVKVFVDLYRMSQNAKRQAEERIALAREQAARAAAEAASRRSALLAEASEALFKSLDSQSTVEQLFSVVLPSLADACIVTLLDDHTRADRTEMAWALPGTPLDKMPAESIPPLLAAALRRVRTSQKAEVIENPGSLEPGGTGRHIDDSRASRSIGLRLSTAAIFPLLARTRMLGVLCLALGPSGRDFSEADLSLAEDLANRTAIALDNAFLYQQLQSADRQKNEFLAVLGHELRNPLAPIRNAVEVLRIAGSDPRRLSWAQSLIERQVKHLARLVDDLLDVSRITRGKIQLQLARVDVAGLVSAAVETNVPLIESRKHLLSVSLPERPLWIKADAARMSQVIGNLLNNSAKYTAEGGRISLTVTAEENEAVFRVADSGVGLSEEMQSTVFDLFARGQRAPNTLQEGLGVGLTLVRRLVEIHGGTVQAYSAGPDRGSEFVVRIPILNEGVNEPREAENPEQSSGHPAASRVLVVDDNEDAAESTALLLRLKGWDVRLACDGPATLKAALAFRPDAVLLDLGLPVMDGYEVARRLRAQPFGERLVIVAASGYGQEHDRRRSAEAGFDDHLVKPLDPSHLTETLASLCSARRSDRPEARRQAPRPVPNK
jgi:signal transduction histidine kinase/DNA-binding response OmpR family regulator